MRRADRLFQIIQFIRGRRLTTAAWLAQRLEISERTVYRDVADLQRQGVPIEGEAGVGYRLGKGFDLPPLMFSAQEAQALVAAVRMVQPWLDSQMANDAQQALSRVISVLPSAERTAAESLAVMAPSNYPGAGLGPAVQMLLQQLRLAIADKRLCLMVYQDGSGVKSQRQVRPLGVFYWGKVWTLAAWCELRQDFRSFRVDRITSLTLLDTHFKDEPSQSLAELMRRIEDGTMG
jgi:predicted DNA-binding transcriptional regulator YafY